MFRTIIWATDGSAGADLVVVLVVPATAKSGTAR